MDEKYIVDVLSNKNRILERIERKRKKLEIEEKEFDDNLKFDEVIRQISLKGKQIKEDILSPTNAQNNIMLSILRRTHREIRKQKNEITRQLNVLCVEEQRVNHIWYVFRLLDGEDYKLLNDIYVKKIKIDYLCKYYKKDRTTLHRNKMKAINKLNVKASERLKNYLLEDNNDSYRD